MSTEELSESPTREEIENGVEYPDYEHYKEGKAA